MSTLEMRALSVFFILMIVFEKSFADDDENMEVDCLDIKSIPLLGSIFTCKSLAQTYDDISVKFLLSSNRVRTPHDVSSCNLTQLQTYFDPSHETIIIIHGYLSSTKGSWMWNLKENLLNVVSAAAIIFISVNSIRIASYGSR